MVIRFIWMHKNRDSFLLLIQCYPWLKGEQYDSYQHRSAAEC